MTEKHIKDIYEFANGNMMVFDQFGKQMPDYQGLDARERLATADLSKATFHGCFVWHTGEKVPGTFKMPRGAA